LAGFFPSNHRSCLLNAAFLLLLSLQDADDEVALEAAEFWLAFCESDLGMELLIPVMSRLIPVLMKNMVSPVAVGMFELMVCAQAAE
jgi:hypothetical protein